MSRHSSILTVSLSILTLYLGFLVPHTAYAAGISDGLVGRWTFDGADVSDKVYDRSGQGNHGYFYNGATSTAKVEGKLGQALNFNGTSNFVRVGNPASLDVTSAGTITAWVKVASVQSDAFPMIAGKFDWNLDRNGYIIAYNSSALTSYRLGLADGASNQMINFGTPTKDQWEFVAFTWDGSFIQPYVNGSPSGSPTAQTVTPTPATQNFEIGKDDDSASRLRGSIDDVRVYNRALTAAEIKQLYNFGKTLKKPANNLGLLAYYKFDEGSGVIATDFSGNGRRGIITPPVTDPAWTTGKFGKALYFDNLGTSVTAANYADDLQNFTVTAWVKYSADGTGDPIVSKLGTGGVSTGPGWGLYFDYTKVFSFVQNSGATQYITSETSSSAPYSDNKWHMVTMVVTGGNALQLYVDASTSGVTNGGPGISSSYSNSSNVMIGNDFDDNKFRGNIDEVRIYGRALTPTEITKLYQSGAGRVGASVVDLQRGSSLENGLVGHWTFDGADLTDKVYDRSGQGNHGYFTGIATSSAKSEGKLGQSIKLNGVYPTVQQSIDIQGSGSVADNLSNMSLSAWVKNNPSGGGSVIMSKANNSAAAGWFFGLTSTGYPNFYTTESLTNYHGRFVSSAAGTTVQDGKWHHIVATLSGGANGTITLYVDGVSQALSSDDGVAPTTYSTSHDIWIGDIADGQPFNGNLDDLRIYSRALSVAEIKQLYKLGQSTVR